MVALTYSDTRVAGVGATPEEAAKPAAPRKPWYARLFDAMVEARMQQARREIRLYTQLMPYTVDEKGFPVLKKNDQTIGGW